MGKLTTHVLDTAGGCPAAGVHVELHRRIGPLSSLLLVSAVTNSDGRCDKPLLEGAAFDKGEYELAFHVGDYFRAQGLRLPEPVFLDVVVIRVGLSDVESHYHVPLLVSPWSYSTYRGS